MDYVFLNTLLYKQITRMHTYSCIFHHGYVIKVETSRKSSFGYDVINLLNINNVNTFNIKKPEQPRLPQ